LLREHEPIILKTKDSTLKHNRGTIGTDHNKNENTHKLLQDHQEIKREDATKSNRDNSLVTNNLHEEQIISKSES